MKRKVIAFFIFFCVCFDTIAFASFGTFPVWQEQLDTTEVNNDNNENFLNLESESAILIEQNSR